MHDPRFHHPSSFMWRPPHGGAVRAHARRAEATPGTGRPGAEIDKRTYVFSVGLIPVQQWIAEARRSRDLWVGSALLSYLMGQVLGTLERDLSADVRLPVAPEGGFVTFLDRQLEATMKDGYGIPNRATGYCEAAGDEELERVFGALEREVVEERWADLAARNLFPSSSPGDRREFWQLVQPWYGTYRELLDGATDCPFSLVWVAKEVEAIEAVDGSREPEDEARLRADLETIDRLYAEVKRTRPVRPWAAGAPVPKCGQCGRREALGPLESFTRWRQQIAQLEALPWLQQGYVADADERLCWVCLTRRMAGYAGGGPAFPSTGDVASAVWLDRIRDAGGEAAKTLEELSRTPLGKEDLGRALYLPVRHLRETGHEPVLELRAGLRRQIRELNSLPARKGELPLAEEPPGYLALLTFDGDEMGRWVHAAPVSMPKKMAEFQASLQQHLKRDHGDRLGIFYLGGDEGLLMAPAAAALDLAHRTREVFREVFGTGDGSPTLSVGIAYAEQSRPMKGTIEAAQLALATAKQRAAKDSLGVAVATASGSRWLLAQRWGPFWDRVRSAVALVQKGRLAAGWAYDVETLLHSLSSTTWQRLRTRPESLRAEVERLLARRVIREPGETREQLHLARRELWVSKLIGPALFGPDEMDEGREAVAAAFHLVGFLARQAGLEPLDRNEGEEAA